MEELKHSVKWEGKATFSDQFITEEQYNTFFDTEQISYDLVLNTLKVCHDSPMELTVDYLNTLSRKEAINKVTYGNKWMASQRYENFPNIRFSIKVIMDNQEYDYYNLPYQVRQYIATQIIEKDVFSGSFNIVNKRH